MKNLIIGVILMTLCFPWAGSLNAQTSPTWGFTLGSLTDDIATQIQTDANGDVYVAGQYSNTMDADPGPGSNLLLTPGGDNIFLCKFTSAGALIWATSFGGSGGGDDLTQMEVTPAGDIILAWRESFAGSGYRRQVRKYNTSGTFQWSYNLPQVSSSAGETEVVVALDGSIYASGSFLGANIDFDNGPGTATMTSHQGSQFYNRSTYLIKLTSTGSFVWVEDLFPIYSSDPGNAMAIDSSGNILVNVQRGGGNYIQKYNPAGTLLFSKGLPADVRGICVAPNGDYYVAGNQYGSATWDGIPIAAPTNRRNPVLARYNSSFNLYWVKNVGYSASDANVADLELNSAGLPVITGGFNDTMDVDPGPGTVDLTHSGWGASMYVASYDGNLNYVSAFSIYTRGLVGYGVGGAALEMGQNGAMYLCSSYWGTKDMDPTAATFNLTSTGMLDAFVLKFGGCSLTPSASASSDTICAGANVTLTGGGTSTGTYAWDQGLGSGVSQVVSPTSTTTYTVTVAEGACTANSSVTVVVTASPTANAGADVSICAGQSTTLNATGGGTYQWDNGLGSGASHSVSPVVSNSYAVTVTNNNNCTAVDTVLVTVVPGPTANAGADVSICAGQSTTLNAAGGGTYQWDNGLGSGATHTVSPLSTTSYAVTVTNSNNCTAVDTVLVTVVPEPTANAGADVSICAGQSTTLNAAGGGTYQWNNGLGSGQSHSVSPVVTTSYAVTVTNSNNCTASDSVLVTVIPGPTANAGADVSICAGQSTTLNAAGGVTYQWNNGLGSGPSHSVNPVVTTSYAVTVTNSNNCTAVDSVLVTVFPGPTANAGADVSICAGQSTTLNAAGGMTYQWNNGLGSGQSHSVSPNATTTYTVTVTNSNNCAATDDVLVTVLPTPIATAGPSTSICPGQSVTITATGGISYQWNNGLGSGASHTVSPASTMGYFVTVTNSSNCTATANVLITVSPAPIANAGADVSICSGQSTTLNASGGGTYQWNNGLGSGQSHSVSPLSTTSYTVTVTNSDNCTATDDIEVTVFPLPSVTVQQTGSVLNASSGFNFYQWMLNGNAIAGANADSFEPTSSGNYSVEVTDSNGCTASSTPFNFVYVGIAEPGASRFDLYPNPSDGSFHVKWSLLTVDEKTSLNIVDLMGKEVWRMEQDAGVSECYLDLKGRLSKGVYMLVVTQSGIEYAKRLIVK